MIIKGDCIEKLKEIPENSVDAVVTDPPYGLGFMGKQWDTFDKSQFGEAGKEGENDLKVKKNFKILPRYNSDGLYDFTKDWATECLRVLKPGGYLLSFSGTRTYHKICMGIEDAGFEIRDMISWLYGSGFPKSLNIGKSIDKMQGNEREDLGENPYSYKRPKGNQWADAGFNNQVGKDNITKGNSEWEGWGTALKPACEPIVVARKPLSEKNVALNVLKWGTGGINIDECRVETDELTGRNNKIGSNIYGGGKGFPPVKVEGNNIGRFPANIILDEEAGKILDEQAPLTGALSKVKSGQKGFGGVIYGKYKTGGDDGKTFHNEKLQGASRFFYCAKASKSERNLGCEDMPLKHYLKENKMGGEGDTMLTGSGNPRDCRKRNNHPTVKPIKLMEYLVKLVSKEGATVLDPFLGSGTTAIACIKLKRKWIGIEREEDYIKIIRARIQPFMKQTTPNLNKTNEVDEV